MQPTSVQSGSALFGAGGVLVEPTVQLEPLQLSEKRFVDPSGEGPSATVDMPPPMLRPPQWRVLRTVFDPSFTSPQLPPKGKVVKSRRLGGDGTVVVVGWSSWWSWWS